MSSSTIIYLAYSKHSYENFFVHGLFRDREFYIIRNMIFGPCGVFLVEKFSLPTLGGDHRTEVNVTRVKELYGTDYLLYPPSFFNCSRLQSPF